MSLFAMADLHLSLSVDKPMDIFGSRWTDHIAKIRKSWCAIVNDDDTVIIPGDISWAIDYKEAIKDFEFINSLPGRKILGKGNHDYWWGTLSKNKAFCDDLNIKSIDFLYNNAFKVEDYIICGTRGWYVDEKLQSTNNNVEYQKIVLREASRLRLSLEEAKKLQTNNEQILAFFHFPPVFNSFVCNEFIDILKEYNVSQCYFGHIHGTYNIPKTTIYEGISFTLVSADYLNFVPMILMPYNY